MPRLSVLVLLAAVGCKDNQPAGCRIAQRTDLPATALTRSADATLQRVGDSFVLFALTGSELRWAPLSKDGALGMEASVALPAIPVGRAVYGVTAKNAPGDQIVVAYPATKGTGFEVVSVSQMAGGTPGAPRPLFDLPADPRALEVAMGSSQSGQRAVVVWGTDSATDRSPQFLLLGPDGLPTADAAPLYRTTAPFPVWSCLSVVPSRGDFAVSLLESGASGKPTWRVFELHDDGGRGYEVSMLLDVMPSGCPTVAATPRGYVVAYQNDSGTFFSDFDIPRSVVNSDIIAGSLRFGGAQLQPRVACVSAMGREFSLVFDRPSGPEVWRIDAFGNIQGSALLLPSMTGSVGGLAAVPRADAMFVTYVDQSSGGNSSGNSRYFVRVECPLALPGVPLDGGGDAEASDAGK